MTAARPDTWMPMFWGDYARDTAHLNDALHGAYLMLIKHYWCSGKPLPDDDDVLWRIACCDSKAAWKKKRQTIAAFFQIEGGEWRHKRIDEEQARAIANVEKRAKAGKKGAAAKWQNDGNANADDNGNRMANASSSQWQNDGTPTPTPPSPSRAASSEQVPREPDPAPVPAAEPAKPDPAVAFIEIFDAVRTEVFGAAQARPWPNAMDITHARRWLEAGADAVLVRHLCHAAQAAKKAKGGQPIGSLSYLTDRVLEAVTGGDRIAAAPPAVDDETAAYRKAFREWDEGGRTGPKPVPPGENKSPAQPSAAPVTEPKQPASESGFGDADLLEIPANLRRTA